MNAALPLLSLSPLLAGTDLLVTALPMAILAVLLPVLMNLLITPLRAQISRQALSIAALLIGAALLSAIDLALRSYSAELGQALQAYLPLYLLPALALAWVKTSTLRCFFASLCASALLVGAAFVREGLGHGSLLEHGQWMFGADFQAWHWGSGWPVLTQAACGFILLGLGLALLRRCHLKEHTPNDERR